MQTTYRKTIRRWLRSFCLWLALAIPAVRAASEPKDIIIPLDERLLAHLETTAEHLAVKEKADPTLKKDFQACSHDKKIAGDTSAAFSASIAPRHPRLTAALAAEGWTPGDFYLTFYTAVSMPMASELSRGGEPDTDKGVRRNVAFFDGHKARILAVIDKINPLLGTAPDKN